jgi:uncharacterized cupin superfamily protein
MKKANLDPSAGRTGSSYPPPFDEAVAGRTSWPLTRQLGISEFGVNRVVLAPGSWSTQRHWHSHCDEVVIVIAGELTALDDGGEQVLRAGDCVSFPAGVANPHHLINRSSEPAVYYDVGGRDLDDVSTFPDMELETKLLLQIKFRPIRERKP